MCVVIDVRCIRRDIIRYDMIDIKDYYVVVMLM